MYTVTMSRAIESTEYQELDYKIKKLEDKVKFNEIINIVMIGMLSFLMVLFIGYIKIN